MTEKQKNTLYEATQSRIVNFNEIGITNDLMFGTVYKNPEYCKELLQRILQINIVEIGIVEPQKTIKTTIIGKGIRIDIYAKDNQGNVYDIEMQSTEETDLHLRTRYYHSEMDSYQIRAGQKYKNLKNSVVIFICTFDPFGLGRHIYTFEKRCSEDTTLTLNDGTVKIILNTKGTLDDVSPEMKRLLDYVDGKGVSDTFTRDLEEAVQSARQNEKWRLDYMTLQQEYRERFQEGKVEGIKEGKIEGLREGKIVGKIETLYEELHMTVVEIAEKLAISEEEVQRIVDAL